jgi:hypothetical protein
MIKSILVIVLLFTIGHSDKLSVHLTNMNIDASLFGVDIKYMNDTLIIHGVSFGVSNYGDYEYVKYDYTFTTIINEKLVFDISGYYNILRYPDKIDLQLSLTYLLYIDNYNYTLYDNNLETPKWCDIYSGVMVGLGGVVDINKYISLDIHIKVGITNTFVFKNSVGVVFDIFPVNKPNNTMKKDSWYSYGWKHGWVDAELLENGWVKGCE